MTRPAVAQPAAEPGPTNATCPVMVGEPIDPAIFADHDGRRVWFCCTKCRARFERNPGKYLVNLVAVESSAESGVGASPLVPPEQAGIPEGPAPEPGRPAGTGEARSRIGEFLGRLHPVSVHFPVALLISAALLEALSMVFRSPRLGHAAGACVVLGALGAGASAGLGWINAEFNPFTGELASTLVLHRWLGIGSASASALTLVLLALGARARGAYRLALALSAALVAVTGYLGGDLVRGPNHLLEGLGGRESVSEPRSAPRGVTAARRAAPDAGAGAAAPAPGRADGDALNRLLFAPDNEAAFIARRELRAARVPAPASVPAGEHPVDHLLRAGWRRAGLPEAADPPAACDDAAFVRRAYLDVIGVIPTIEESTRFFGDARADRRDRLIDELLARDADYADHWTPFWEDALGSANTELQGGVPTRGNYRTWINDAFRANKPFDVMVAELIDPSMPGHQDSVGANANGKVTRVGYVRNDTPVDTMQTAANAAQVFLGTSMKCASCHSHFENPEWPQQRFLAFAGMFGGRDLEVIRCEARTGEMVSAAFPFDIPGAPRDVPVDEAGRLRRVAQLLTDPLNPRFARSIVNRLWKRYLGLGFFEPADDFRMGRAASAEPLLDWLAADFVTHGYDLKRTIRLILTSRAYGARFDPGRADVFDVQRPGEPRHFRSPALRRLTAEQLIDSMRVAASQSLDPSSRLFRDTSSTPLTRALGRPASRNEISTGRPDDVAVVQGLELLNGPEFHALASATRIRRDAAAGASLDVLVDRVYRAVLSRPATEGERRLAVEYLRSAMDRESLSGSSPPEPRERVFIDDHVPRGAHVSVGDWPWATDRVLSGMRSHRQASGGKQVQHYALGTEDPMPVGPGDTLFVHVCLDPGDPPRQIMIQWNDGGGNDGGWAHRAFWGENLIRFGTAGTPSRRAMGPLPPAGEWVRIEVPASAVGFTGAGRVVGMSFDQVGGTVWWDRSGVVGAPPDALDAALGDLMWALFASPEFQYVR